MAEHVTLTDPNLHEPKGVALATAGQVYVTDGSGSGAMEDLAQKSPTVVQVEYTPIATVTPALPDVAVPLDSTTGTWLVQEVIGDISVDADGVTTINKDGWYQVSITGRASPEADVTPDNITSALQLWRNGMAPAVTSGSTIKYTHFVGAKAGDPVPFAYTRSGYFTAGEYITPYHLTIGHVAGIDYDNILVSCIKVGD